MLSHTPWTRVRTVVNWVNLSTPLGLLVAWAGGATIVKRGRGTYVAGGYRWRFPVASAFTVGSVIVSTRETERLIGRERLLRHEDRHVTQYAWCVGPVMLLLYVLCAGYSYVVAGDHSSYNPFERLAGLAEGGYPEPRTRWAENAGREG
ncbi:MAG: hypothetical protein QM621_09275 [Aeromicrobium sp.]|uniref:hypothetical protein n=1 Tax=Aeromicrobium sp. TaxID=1871063 RepID=UPI0039E405C8